MMDVLASHFVDDVNDDLSHIQGLPIQLAFYKRATFKGFDHEFFLSRLEENNITVKSIHAPAADVYHHHGDEFINMLGTIKKHYGVKIITVHPQRGQKRHARNLYGKIEDRIRELDVVIAYETFESIHDERKWITQVEDMHRYFDAMKFNFLGVTYDFTHSESPRNIKEIRHFHRRIHAVHLSDARSDMPLDPNEKHQHLPLGEGNYHVLDFLDVLTEIKYQGLIILEYLPKYRHLLKGDTLLMQDYTMGRRGPFLAVYHKRRGCA